MFGKKIMPVVGVVAIFASALFAQEPKPKVAKKEVPVLSVSKLMNDGKEVAENDKDEVLKKSMRPMEGSISTSMLDGTELVLSKAIQLTPGMSLDADTGDKTLMRDDKKNIVFVKQILLNALISHPKAYVEMILVCDIKLLDNPKSKLTQEDRPSFLMDRKMKIKSVENGGNSSVFKRVKILVEDYVIEEIDCIKLLKTGDQGFVLQGITLNDVLKVFNSKENEDLFTPKYQ